MLCSTSFLRRRLIILQRYAYICSYSVVRCPDHISCQTLQVLQYSVQTIQCLPPASKWCKSGCQTFNATLLTFTLSVFSALRALALSGMNWWLFSCVFVLISSPVFGFIVSSDTRVICMAIHGIWWLSRGGALLRLNASYCATARVGDSVAARTRVQCTGAPPPMHHRTDTSTTHCRHSGSCLSSSLLKRHLR